MSTNRLFVLSRQHFRFFALNSARLSSAVYSPTAAKTTVVQTEDQEHPGFFQKVALRFKGIPLKGETHPPRSLFDDCDKEFVVTTPLPTVSKDFKEFPERDLVNFPFPERHLYPPKTRLFMIPDSWMTPFQKITGTSGPYVFIGGLAIFLNSKEIFVIEENAMKLTGFWLMYWIFSRTLQLRLDQFLYKNYVEHVNKYKQLIDDDVKDAVESCKTSAAETESLKAAHEFFPTILKENLALQLEAIYRQKVHTVVNELQRRIDYLQEVESTKLRFERDIFLKSITEGVQKQIANNEGNIKDLYLDNCILQIKGLSA